MLQELLQGTLILCLLGFLTNSVAYHYGYFNRPSYPRAQVRFTNVVTVFAIYLSFIFVMPILLQTLATPPMQPTPVMMQLGASFAMLSIVFLYIFTEKSGAMSHAMKNPESASSRWKDFGLGILVWTIAFPWVAAINQICDYILDTFMNFQSYEQIAVRYLKENLDTTHEMVVALIGILVVAPIMEEILFRGTLQQLFKKHLSVKTSIILTALIFAIFHYSPEQELGNLSLIPSLFIFACFLGYTYERQGSIYASIGLHITFNVSGVVQILNFS